MEKKDIIVGLDIGTTKIACIVGHKNEYGKLEILGYGKSASHGVRRGVVINIEDTVNGIKEAVAQAEAQSQVDIKYVNIGIAGQHIKSMQHRGGVLRENPEEEITRKEVEKLTQSMYQLNMMPGEEIIDVIPQDYIIDDEYDVRQPVGMLGSHLEANFHIIIAQTTAAKNIYKCIKKAGLEDSQLILEPIASSEAVLSHDEKEAGVVLVDIGGGTTDIAIFQDGIIRWTAVIPFGGDIITEDVKEGCTIIKRHAEELKVKFGSALAEENSEDDVVAIPGLRGRPPKEITLKMLATIIQARVDEIIDHIIYEIKNSGFEKKLIAGIVITGGGSQLKHIKELVQFRTGIDTRIGYPNEHLANDTNEDLKNPTFSTGIGLVIEGIKRYEMEKQLSNEITENNTESEGKDKKGNGKGNAKSASYAFGLKRLSELIRYWWFEVESKKNQN